MKKKEMRKRKSGGGRKSQKKEKQIIREFREIDYQTLSNIIISQEKRSSESGAV